MEYSSNAGNAINAITQALQRGLTKSIVLVQGDAKQRCPVNKYEYGGHLRESIGYEVEDATAQAGTNVEYGPYVELGTGIYAKDNKGRKTPWVYKTDGGKYFWTKGQKPQPFLQPAFMENVGNTQRIMEEELKQVGK